MTSSGWATRLWNHSGFSGAPPFDATSAYSPPCSTRMTGFLRTLPLLAPRVRHHDDRHPRVHAACWPAAPPEASYSATWSRTHSHGLGSYSPCSVVMGAIVLGAGYCPTVPREPMAAADVLAFHQTLSNWGRWGDDDQLGALNLITPEVTAAAAATVRAGPHGVVRPPPRHPGGRRQPDPGRPPHDRHGHRGLVAPTTSPWRRTASPPAISTPCATSSTRASSTTATRPRP